VNFFAVAFRPEKGSDNSRDEEKDVNIQVSLAENDRGNLGV